MSDLAKPENTQIQEPSIINKIEHIVKNTLRVVELPLRNIFTKENGKYLYGRSIFIPAGCVLTSRIHKHQHQFIISQGHIKVYDETSGTQQFLKAPYHGITEPGTRRALHAITDTIWTTFHITDKNDPDEIVEEVSERSSNPLLEEITL